MSIDSQTLSVCVTVLSAAVTETHVHNTTRIWNTGHIVNKLAATNTSEMPRDKSFPEACREGSDHGRSHYMPVAQGREVFRKIT